MFFRFGNGLVHESQVKIIVDKWQSGWELRYMYPDSTYHFATFEKEQDAMEILSKIENEIRRADGILDGIVNLNDLIPNTEYYCPGIETLRKNTGTTA